MAKPKLAIYWGMGCGGCDVAILDINEKILDVASHFELALWPCAADFKYADVEKLEDGSISVCLFNGAVRNSEHEHLAKLLSKKSRLMIAYGTCACFGGLPGLANLSDRKAIFETVYSTTDTTVNEKHVFPEQESKVKEGTLTLPEFWDTVKPLHDVVPVHYYVPGCPPPPELTVKAIEAIISEKLPPPGATIASERALCDECRRKKKEERKLEDIKSPHEVIADPEICFLDQNIICLGPATRGGCGNRCLNANMPCRGCFGPVEDVLDQGAKFSSAIASIIEGDSPEEVEKMMNKIQDPVGLFYRFSLPDSILKRAKLRRDKEK